jgi:hypothetical protein
MTAVKKAKQSCFSQPIFWRTVVMAVLLACLHGAVVAQGQDAFKATVPPVHGIASTAENSANCRIIYLGFVGALEPANNKNSGVNQIRDTLQGKEYPDVCAKSFSPHIWIEGRDWLLKYFPAHAGTLTPEELQHSPKVILVGHSMGGWAIMSVARELRSRDIPVELTIQVDSVGITDYTIPRNVKSAAIFHANDVLMFMTTKHMRMEDPEHTKMVADIKVAGANHQSITRDPRIRELVMEKVQSLRAALPEKLLPEAAQPSAQATIISNQR